MQKWFIIIYCCCISILFAKSDTNAGIEKRIQTLLDGMSLEEKIGQMSQISMHATDIPDPIRDAVAAGRLGSVLNAGNLETKQELQKIAVQESPSGIPLIFGRDVIHGYQTVLPIPLGQSCSWNPDLIELGARMAAAEASANGVHWTFAPMIDITRDPRWGRIAETCGEDPYLTSVLARAMVRGFQSDNLSAADALAACAKHYVGYGAAIGGRDYNTTLIPERQCRNIYLPSFHAAVDEGIATLMSAFNDLNGIPASGNHFTLTQILRDEWEFDGFVVSDWESMEEMIDHGFCKDMQSVAYKSVTAGVDMEMVSDAYWTELKGLVEQGVVSEELVDERVANILRIKLRKGLFDRAFTQNDRQDVILSEPHLQLTRKLAQQSFVLLKNRDHTLPLSDSLSIAMIGPLADAPRDQMGTWAMDGRVDRVVTPRQAFQERLENDRFHYAPGLSSSRDTSHAEFDVAVTAAEQSDAVVMILGEEQILSGEAKSRAFLDLPGAQAELFAAVAKTGKPVITVIMAGRPLTFAAIAEKSDAVLYAWHPGTLGGPALADVLFGDVSPSGKLTTTFPRTVGQIPIYYNHRSTGRPPLESELGIPTGTPQDPRNFRSDYLDVDFTPAYPFGYGLSYTSFRYDNLVLSSPSMSKTEQIIISAEITNTGSMPGTEIVQLYIQDRYGSITRPVRELKGFQRVTLNPGESQTVSFELNAEQCSFYAMDNTPIIEPGTFSIWVAKDAASGLKGSFRITEK